MQIEIEKIICDLIRKYLVLPQNYGFDKNGNEIPTVVIRGQNVKLFNTPKIQITVSTIGTNTFSNRCEHFAQEENGEMVYYERVCLNEQRQMQIDIYSKNNEARQRFWEVQASLTSTYSQQLQDKYQFRLSKMSNTFNTTGIEGGSDLNRFSIRFNCLTWQEKITPVEYYNSFSTEAMDRDKFADFTITENVVIDNT